MFKSKKIVAATLLAFGMTMAISIPGHAKAAEQKQWQSVQGDGTGVSSFSYYVKYGDLSIARNDNKVHVKTKSGETDLKTIHGMDDSCGGVLTDGKNILYQKGKNVYVWKNGKKQKKLCTFKRKSDILIARYGNDIYFNKYYDYDSYHLYKYNLKSGKTIRMDYYGAYFGNGKYMIIDGDFHEGCSVLLNVYNMETGKVTTLAKDAIYANAGIIRGKSIYYRTLNNMTGKSKIVKCDMKTKKKTVLKKNVPTNAILLDKNHYSVTDENSSTAKLCKIK